MACSEAERTAAGMARKGKYMSITPKQEKFAQEVASGKSQADAYRAAFNCAKSKPETIIKRASELMTSGEVSGRVKELQGRSASRAELTAERVLREVSRLAFFDIRKIFNEDGTLKKIWELDDDTAAGIAGIEAIDIGGEGQLMISKKFKVADKNAALEKLCKHLGLYAPQKVEHSGGVVVTAAPLDEEI